jgi:Flp pilus assembly pilin Flp
LWSDEQGQSTTEYILILSVVVMIAMKFKSQFGEKIKGVVDSLTGQIGDVVNEGSR